MSPFKRDDDLAVNIAGFRRRLRAENLWHETEVSYLEATAQLARYLAVTLGLLSVTERRSYRI
jgi:hypothetical protein